MHGKRHFEIMIVGAGPVGMTTALLLAQKGIRVALIDRESGPARRSYACALHPRTVDILESAGLLEPLLEEGHRIETMSFYEGGLRQAGIDFSALTSRHPYVLVLPQSALESLLAQKLQANPNVELLWNHRLTNLEIGPLDVTARVDRLAKSAQGYAVPEVEWETDVSLEFSMKYLVGADGFHSRVRRCLGIEYELMGEPERFAVFEIESAGLTGSEMKVVLHDRTASVLWPFGGHRCRWGFQLSKGEEVSEEREKERAGVDFIEVPGMDDSAHRLRAFLEERVPWFDQPVKEVDWAAEVRFEPRLAKSFARERCWLAGDAAHQIGPIGMKSMNIGIAEGADLANRLAGVFRGRLEAAPLLSFDIVHRSEWLGLLGIEHPGMATPGATEWVEQHAELIPGMVPASGEHLEQLLHQLSLAGQV